MNDEKEHQKGDDDQHQQSDVVSEVLGVALIDA